MEKEIKVGMVVRHKEYGFEGTVIAFDAEQPIVKITKGEHPFSSSKDTYVASPKNLEIIHVFTVGDIITGTPESDSKYGWTTSKMTKGEIVEVKEGGKIRVKVLEHEESYPVGETYTVSSEYFQIEPLKVGDIVTGTPESDKKYGYTTTKMLKAEVIVANADVIRLKVLEHELTFEVGCEYNVNPKYFVRVKPEVEVEEEVATEPSFESVLDDLFKGVFGTDVGTDTNGKVEVKLADGTELKFEHALDFMFFVGQTQTLNK